MTEYKRAKGSGLYDALGKEICQGDILVLEDNTCILAFYDDKDEKWEFAEMTEIYPGVCAPIYTELPASAKIVIFACEEE